MLGRKGLELNFCGFSELTFPPHSQHNYLFLHLGSHNVFSSAWHFPIVFYSSNFSQKTDFPQGVKDCGLLIFPCQCQEQCLTLGILGASGVFVAFI